MVSRGIPEQATAFAPATVANVAVGFDILGFALEDVGDRATVRVDRSGRAVRIDAIEGRVSDLPTDPGRNTASAALISLIEGHGLDHGFRIRLHKGIPLGSGMGGSAASAVAAVVAANHLLERPLDLEDLLPHCLAGEEVASGAPHADNAAPCLYGGLTATVAGDPPRVLQVPLPAGLTTVLVHPRLEIETRAARSVLPAAISLTDHVRQSMDLSGFLIGCFRNDPELIGRSMVDRIAEPARSGSIPGFVEARAAALRAGALGFGIAGSGPSVFAWALDVEVAARVEGAVRQALGSAGLEVESWVGPIRMNGAAVVPE